MRTAAAIARAPDEPFAVEPVELRDAGDGEVLVRIAGVGICHTDLRARDLKAPVVHPVVLGHEGAGIVEAVGPGVAGLAPGDHVVLTFRSCGECGSCSGGVPSLCADFDRLNFGGTGRRGCLSQAGVELNGSFFGQSAFAGYAIADARNAVRIRDDVPIEVMGPLGCSVQTGAGTVLNVLRSVPGAGIAIFGAGAVGLSSVMAAAMIGVEPIVAVDVNRSRLDLAIDLGATHAVDAGLDPAAEIRSLTGGVGVARAVDTTGRPDVVEAAVSCLAKPGTCAVVAAGEPGSAASLGLRHLLDGRSVVGAIEGMSVPHRFIPFLVDRFAEGKLPFDRLVRRYALSEINEAAAEMENGAVVKPILMPDPPSAAY